MACNLKGLDLPSNAFVIHLRRLLIDADELNYVHAQLRTGTAGRQYGLGSVNRAAIVMCVSAWESYVEELIRESLQILRSAAPGFAAWAILSAYVDSQLARFNTPNSTNVQRLLRETLGVSDVHLAWNWQNCTSTQAIQRLTDAMNYRHQIAHGVNPRPIIHNSYAAQLPNFLRRLARCTDDAVRTHLVTAHGVNSPWPP